MSNAISNSRIKILIIEDESIVAMDIEQALERLGYIIIGITANGDEAIRIIEKERPDLILTDIKIKGKMNGIEAATIIRERFNIPTVFLTAYSDELTLQRVKESEPLGYLLKPFNEAELHTTIEVAFHKHRMTQIQQSKSARALERSEESFKLLVESVKDCGIFMLDPQGFIVSWNVGAELIYGYSADEIIGQHFSCFYPKNAIENGRPQQDLEIASKEGRIEVKDWKVYKNGHEFWSEVVTTALRDEDGNLRGFARVIRDLTEQKKAEDQLRLANETLERTVQERTADLRQALNTRDEFLSIASHELKGPLTSLYLQLQFLNRSLTQGVPNIQGAIQKVSRILQPDTVLKIVRSCEDQSKKMSKMLDELLDLTQIRIGKFELHKKDIDLSAILRKVVEDKELELSKQGINISIQAHSPVVGKWDGIRMEQVVNNLLSNAIKYGEGKPIEISVSSPLGKNAARLVIKDYGIGISPEMQPRVFERFERAGATRNIFGLGLGLYIVRQIIEAHGGVILVDSSLGHGSTFVIELPLA